MKDRAILGARAGRTTNEQTVAACDRLLPREARGYALFYHSCDGYGQYLAWAESCEACGWSPRPTGSLSEMVRALVRTYGVDDARDMLSAEIAALEWTSDRGP